MNLPQSLFLRIAPIALATLLAACGQAPQAAPPAGPIQVGTYTVQAQALPLTTELPGRTNAYRIAEVRPHVNGILPQPLSWEGAPVKVGTPLLQLARATITCTLQHT